MSEITDEISINDNNETLDDWMSKDFITNNLKENLKLCDVILLPDIMEKRPIFTENTLELYHFLRKSSEFKTEICISDKDFHYRRPEASLDIINIGNFFIKGIKIFKDFIKKIKNYLKNKFREDKKIEFSVIVEKKTTKKKITKKIKYKGAIEGLDKIFEHVERIK